MTITARAAMGRRNALGSLLVGTFCCVVSLASQKPGQSLIAGAVIAAACFGIYTIEDALAARKEASRVSD